MICRAFHNEIPEALAYCSDDLLRASNHPGPVDMPGWIETWRDYVRSGSGILFLDLKLSVRKIFGVLGALYFTDPATGIKKATELLYYIKPEHRGHGGGRKLYREFVAEAKQRGTRLLQMSVLENDDPGSEVLRGMYLREGFSPLETIHIKDLWAGQEQ